MALEVKGEVVATARFSEYAAADGSGAWIVSTHPARLFSRSQAIKALTLAECLAIGYGDTDPHVIAWRKELFLADVCLFQSHHRVSAGFRCARVVIAFCVAHLLAATRGSRVPRSAVRAPIAARCDQKRRTSSSPQTDCDRTDSAQVRSGTAHRTTGASRTRSAGAPTVLEAVVDLPSSSAAVVPFAPAAKRRLRCRNAIGCADP
jgi:hypothetical protein